MRIAPTRRFSSPSASGSATRSISATRPLLGVLVGVPLLLALAMAQLR
jgi:hypothetical protein